MKCIRIVSIVYYGGSKVLILFKMLNLVSEEFMQGRFHLISKIQFIDKFIKI